MSFGKKTIARVITPRAVNNGELYGIPSVERASTMPPAVSVHLTALMIKPMLVSHARRRPTLEDLDLLLAVVPMKKKRILSATHIAEVDIQAMDQSAGNNAQLVKLLVVLSALTTQASAQAMLKTLLLMFFHWLKLLLLQLLLREPSMFRASLKRWEPLLFPLLMASVMPQVLLNSLNDVIIE
jgi:hypothetical protein